MKFSLNPFAYWAEPRDPAYEEWVPPAPATGFGGHPAGSQEEWDALERAGRVGTLPPQPKPTTTILGGFVAKLHASIAKTKASAAELEAQIAKDTETLRQMRVSIAAMEAGLVTIGTDPALTAEELGLVDEPFAPTMAEALEEGLTDGQE